MTTTLDIDFDLIIDACSRSCSIFTSDIEVPST